MGVLQARLVLVGLLGIIAAISYNALFLQKGRHPAPFSSETTIAGTARSGTTRPADGAQTARGRRRKTAAAVPSRDTVRAIQRELGSRDYDPGPVDGVAGLLTRAAIMAYQHDNGLAATGEASSELLQQIVLGKTGKPVGTARNDEMPEETTALIKAIQQVLAKLGYAPGPVDGIAGASTRKAIGAFERERGLAVTGRVSGKLLRQLMRVTGAKLSNLPTG